MADNGYTKNYQDGSALTETQLDTAYKSLKLDISNTTQLTQGATAGHYLKCVTPGGAAQFSALPTAALPTTPVVSKVADYVITDTDGVYTVLVTTGGSNITITLPTAADNEDRIIVIKKVDSGSGSVIIEGESAETIEGVANKVLLQQYESIQVQCDGTGWYMLSWNTPTYKEIKVSTATSVGATSVYSDLTSLSLEAGEWELGFGTSIIRNSATFSVIDIQVGIGLTTGNVATIDAWSSSFYNSLGNNVTTFTRLPFTLSGYKVNPTTTTTYYLKGYVGNYTVNTPRHQSTFYARRIKP